MNTKQVLMDSYLNMGMTKGFDNVSLQDLAISANIKKASIFSHFRDYSDLKQQALESCLYFLQAKDFAINPKANNMEDLFFALVNSFIGAFSEFPINSLLCLIEQKKTYDIKLQDLSDKIDLMISSRFQVALDYCVQRSWTDFEDTDEIVPLLTAYLRKLLVKQNMSDDDLSDMLDLILHILR